MVEAIQSKKRFHLRKYNTNNTMGIWFKRRLYFEYNLAWKKTVQKQELLGCYGVNHCDRVES